MRNLCIAITTIVASVLLAGTASAAIIHVPSDYPAIQTAINAASDGDTILVAPGTYYESDINFNGKDLIVQSASGPDVTTVDGSGGTYVFFLDNDEPETASIDGFTLIGSQESKVRITDASVTVNNCKFTGPMADTSGSCIYTWMSTAPDGTPHACNITACVFEGLSQYTGSLVSINGDPSSHSVISNCSFLGNTFSQIYSYCINCSDSVTISSTTFEDNQVGNVISIDGDDSRLEDCVLRNNNCTSSSALRTGSNDQLQVVDCTFEGNQSDGQGAAIRASLNLLDNCVIANNYSSNGVSGVYILDGDPVISNTRFCENDNEDIFGSYKDGGGNEFLADCDDIEGACCVDGDCYEVEQFFCENSGGTWLGFNVICESETCSPDPQFGACCVNGEAVLLFDYDCALISGWFAGEGTDPDSVTCPSACLGDANDDGEVNVNDILIVISQYGVTCP